MGNRGHFKQQAAATQYSEQQIAKVLRGLGIKVVSDTYNDFLCFCPIHGNTHTPSFSVSKHSGQYICFNPACAVTGTLNDLVMIMTGRNEFETLRFVAGYASEENDFEDDLFKLLSDDEEFKEWDTQALDKMRSTYVELGDDGYMASRGFTQETTDYFQIGYSPKMHMVVVPVHSPDGILVGIVGRAIEKKVFKNSKGLPTSRTMFNIHRAKREADTVIITESAFDTMSVHQAGYPNVVGNLGGHMSPRKLDLLDKYFNKIIIFTDWDQKQFHNGCRLCYPSVCQGHNPGRDLGYQIADALSHKSVLWASVGPKQVYPEGAKDASDMTPEQIRQAITNAVPDVEYRFWNLY